MSFWTEIEDWPEDLQAVHAVHIPIGKILFWGQGTPNEMENLDVYLMEETQSGYQFTNYGLEDNKIYCSGHTVTKSGKVVIIGGELSEIGKGAEWGTETTFVFDLGENPVWQQKNNMNSPRWYADALRINTGEIFAFVGTKQPGVNAIVPEKIAEDVSGEWEEIEDAELSMPVYPFLYQVANNKVFYAGRDYNTSVEMKTYSLDLSTEQWSVVQDYSTGGALRRVVGYCRNNCVPMRRAHKHN